MVYYLFWTTSLHTLVNSPDAVPSMSITDTTISVDDGLLRINTTSTCPLASLTMYNELVKDTVITTK